MTKTITLTDFDCEAQRQKSRPSVPPNKFWPRGPPEFQVWNKTLCPGCFLVGCIQVPVFTKPTHLPSLSLASQSSSLLKNIQTKKLHQFFLHIFPFYSCFLFSFCKIYCKHRLLSLAHATTFFILQPSPCIKTHVSRPSHFFAISQISQKLIQHFSKFSILRLISQSITIYTVSYLEHVSSFSTNLIKKLPPSVFVVQVLNQNLKWRKTLFFFLFCKFIHMCTFHLWKYG